MKTGVFLALSKALIGPSFGLELRPKKRAANIKTPNNPAAGRCPGHLSMRLEWKILNITIASVGTSYGDRYAFQRLETAEDKIHSLIV